MNPSIVYLAEADGLNSIISNIGSTVQALGATIAGVSFVVAAVLIIVGFFGNGKMRQHISMIAVIGLGCIVLGGGTVWAGTLIDTGESVTGDTGGGATTGDGF